VGLFFRQMGAVVGFGMCGRVEACILRWVGCLTEVVL